MALENAYMDYLRMMGYIGQEQGQAPASYSLGQTLASRGVPMALPTEAEQMAYYQPRLPEDTGLSGGMNLIPLSYEVDPESGMMFGDRTELANALGVTPAELRFGSFSFGNRGGMADRIIEQYGIEPNRIVTIGGEKYLIG